MCDGLGHQFRPHKLDPTPGAANKKGEVMTRKVLTLVLPVAACSLFGAAQVAAAGGPAKEGTFETIICVAGPMPSITDGKIATVLSWDVVGTPMAKEGELLYGTSARCVGSTTIVGKELTEDGACLYTDGDGDRFLFMYSGRSEPGKPAPGTWKFVAGTGKFDGMEASGAYIHVNQPAKQARADSYYNGCDKDSGHWKLK